MCRTPRTAGNPKRNAQSADAKIGESVATAVNRYSAAESNVLWQLCHVRATFGGAIERRLVSTSCPWHKPSAA
jgi:hypothetical protein